MLGSRAVSGNLFFTRDLRLDVGGVPAVDGLTCTPSDAHTLAVVGAPRVLFEAAAGLVRPVQGSIEIGGISPVGMAAAKSDHDGPGAPIAGAWYDMPTPDRDSPLTYVSWSARLAGFDKRQARARAREALGWLGMHTHLDVPLGKMAPIVRRTAIIAAAFAASRDVVVLFDPTAPLEAATASRSDAPVLEQVPGRFAATLRRALTKRRSIVFCPHLSFDDPLALAFDEAIVIGHSEVLARGPVSSLATNEKEITVTLLEPRPAFFRELSLHSTLSGGPAEPDRVATVTLSTELTSLKIFEIARATDAIIVEISPVTGAFA